MPLDTSTYQSTNTTFNAEFRVWQYFDSAHTYVQAEVGGRVSSWTGVLVVGLVLVLNGGEETDFILFFLLLLT